MRRGIWGGGYLLPLSFFSSLFHLLHHLLLFLHQSSASFFFIKLFHFFLFFFFSSTFSSSSPTSSSTLSSSTSYSTFSSFLLTSSPSSFPSCLFLHLLPFFLSFSLFLLILFLLSPYLSSSFPVYAQSPLHNRDDEWLALGVGKRFVAARENTASFTTWICCDSSLDESDLY